ncbi:hypothetical protein OM416_20345 [Paenibacillus sp. LS1]|uniref:hypothetical protein n=1 Tax=Paenibacillus sp. LS1 TaxID=2992120 RepID=UPI00223137D0|nr:hypothetical protein [Paenibacillus sp. LS1]MCW3793948.1 hypothetical protein [Paenibacillus sp. LS1]
MTKPIFQRGVGKTFTPARSNEDKEDYIEILNQIYYEKNFSSSNKFLEYICKEAIEYIQLKEQHDGSLPMKQTQNGSTNVTLNTQPHSTIEEITIPENSHQSALTTKSDTVSNPLDEPGTPLKSAAERARERLAKTKLKP